MFVFTYLIRTYWKLALVAIILLTCAGFVANEIHIRHELADARVEIATLKSEKQELTNHLTVLADLSKEQSKKLDDAKALQGEIMADLSKKINTLKLQQIPKDCTGAIDYAIKNKGDLTWPK